MIMLRSLVLFGVPHHDQIRLNLPSQYNSTERKLT